MNELEKARDAARAEARAARKALAALLRGAVPGADPSGSKIATLLATNTGGVWGSEPGVDECDVAVYRSTEFANDGWVNPASAAIRSVSRRQFESRAVREGDILLEKSGGTPTRPVGRAVRCSTPPVPSIASNFVQLIRANPSSVDAAFLFWALWSWHERGIPNQFQSATTNIRNLRTREYLDLGLMLPSVEQQVALSSSADALQAVAVRAHTIGERLERLHAIVLGQLLSGRMQLNVSYDRFLDGAA